MKSCYVAAEVEIEVGRDCFFLIPSIAINFFFSYFSYIVSYIFFAFIRDFVESLF